ncbi:MAG: hypothetical protein KGL39_03410 [Patescibacteria group bacterium]|nr:hypothetical protein [Patescibacteria group bacterium]
MSKTPDPSRVKAGLIVDYCDMYMGDILPAIVTRVTKSADHRVVLTAFQPGTTPFAVPSAIPYNADRKTKGTWSFPLD